MQIADNGKKRSLSPAIIALIAVAAVCAVILVVMLGMFSHYLGGDTIYNGIYAEGVSLGGLTQAEAEKSLAEKFTPDAESDFTITCGDASQIFKLGEAEPFSDTAGTAARAYGFARTGSKLSRLKQAIALKKQPLELSVDISFNDEVIGGYIEKLNGTVTRPVEEMTAELTDKQLIITPGKPGEKIVFASALQEIISAIKAGKSAAELTAEIVQPAAPNAAELHKEFGGEPIDASFEVVNNEIKYKEGRPAAEFDVAEAGRAITEANGGVVHINVTLKPQKVTVEQLKAKMFRDLLATYSSKYNQGVAGRSYNVYLASKYINGKLLAPGAVFSYNETVGPRTTSRGFREANVYVGNQVEMGVGGGICQVSSTLFNAAVLSDLKIETRTSHSLPVSYVPLGRDATVSYGSVDFKFSNSLSMPVKIVASASGGVNTISIYGTKENPNRKVSFETELVKTIPAGVKRTEDPSLAAGKVNVEVKGSSGYIYNTYRIVTENGNVTSRSLLSKSNYSAVDRVERVGTGAAEAAAPLPAAKPEPQEQPKPTAAAPTAAAAEAKPSIQPVSPSAE